MGVIRSFARDNIWNLLIWALFAVTAGSVMSGRFAWYFARQFLTMAFMVLGVTLEMMSGLLDLSFVAEVSAATCIGAALLAADVPLFAAVGTVILFHLAAGMIRGCLVARLRVNGAVVTLALQVILSGLFDFFTGEAVIFFRRREVYASVRFWAGALLLYAVLFVLLSFLLHRSYYGKYVRMMGEDLQAFADSGLDYVPIRMIVCTASSLCFSAASVIILFITSSGSSMNGNHYLYPVLAAACLGGVNFFNGRGKLYGAVLGTVSMVLLLYMTVRFGLQSGSETALEGFLIIVSVVWNVFRDKN